MIGLACLKLHQVLGGPQRSEFLWKPSEVRDEVAALGLTVQRVEPVCLVELPTHDRDSTERLRALRAESNSVGRGAAR